MAPITCGVVATAVVGGAAIQQGYFAEEVVTTEEMVMTEVLVEGTSTVIVEADRTLPVLNHYTCDDGTLSLYVSDADSGIDYGETFCELIDGSRLDASSFDSNSGRIDFEMPKMDFTVYIADNTGNVQDVAVEVEVN